jgi:hypothetical protein
MGTSEIREPETEIKTGEEDVEPAAPAVAVACASVACSVSGNVKFEDSPQITSGPASWEIKIFTFKKVFLFFMIVYRMFYLLSIKKD